MTLVEDETKKEEAKERSIGRQDTLLSSIRRNRTRQCHRDWQRGDHDRQYAHVAFEDPCNRLHTPGLCRFELSRYGHVACLLPITASRPLVSQFATSES